MIDKSYVRRQDPELSYFGIQSECLKALVVVGYEVVEASEERLGSVPYELICEVWFKGMNIYPHLKDETADKLHTELRDALAEELGAIEVSRRNLDFHLG